MHVSYPTVRLSYLIVHVSYSIVYHVKVNNTGTVIPERLVITLRVRRFASVVVSLGATGHTADCAGFVNQHVRQTIGQFRVLQLRPYFCIIESTEVT